MNKTKVSAALKDGRVGQNVEVRGWVRTRRDSKQGFSFVELNDGSCMASLQVVIDAIDPRKDIDGIHPLNAGLLAVGYEGYLPATADASVELLKRSDIELLGKHAAVVGRSAVIGKRKRRAPVASKIAFAMAPPMVMMAGSPPP